MKVKSMYPTITYGWLREAADEAEKSEHIEGMEQLLQSQFECICQLSDTLQEYEKAMMEQTAEKLECGMFLCGYEKLHGKRFFEIIELKAELQLYCEALQQMTAERNRYEELYKMLSARIRKAYWELC